MEEKDTMMIRTTLMKSILGKLLERFIKKKTGGRRLNISINEFEAENIDGEVWVRACISARMSTVEFAALMEQINS